MKKILIVLFAWLLTLPVFSQSSFPNDELILMMHPTSTEADLQDLLDDLDMHLVDGPTMNLGAMLVKLNTPPIIPPYGNPNDSIKGKKEEAEAISEVTGSGFNFDLSSSNYNTSQLNEQPDNNCYDILDPSTQPNGGNAILTGIFDTGISASMPSGNGYFDPTDLGHNLLNPNFPPNDNNGHGSHISSIVMNNLENANAAVQLKAYKTHDAQGSGNLFDVIKALDLAISDGVQIINMSFGYKFESNHSEEIKAPLKVCILKAMMLNGILCIAAAGNDNIDNDYTQGLSGISAFPASFNCPNIISVASAKCSLQKSSFSNYGVQSVDVFAPGENIWGYNENWNLMAVSGTSQATAFVTKLATYLGTHQTQFNWYDTKCAILNSTVNMQASGLVLTDGYINSQNALNHLLSTVDCTDYPAYKTNQYSEIPQAQEISLITNGDYTVFEIPSSSDQQVEVLISNIQGHIIHRQLIQLNKGKGHYSFDFRSKAQRGIYFLSVKDHKGIRSIKFIR